MTNPIPEGHSAVTPSLVVTPCADAIAWYVDVFGATEIGDLAGRIEDPFGHSWGLGQHVEDVDDEEMARRVADLYAED